MTHAKSLQLVGQQLELAKISHFRLGHDGEDYTVDRDLPSGMAEWMLLHDQPLIFSDADLKRLNLEAKRRQQLSISQRDPTKLSHGLRALGNHLDRVSVRTFRIVWTPEWVVVNYTRAGGMADRRRFTPAELRTRVSLR